MKYKKFTDNEKKQMAIDYSNGDSLKVIADRFGVSIPTMAKYVRAGGGSVRKPGTIAHGNGDYVKTVEAVNEILAAQAQDVAEVVVSEPVAAPVRVLLPID